jgi:hypothetical protein
MWVRSDDSERLLGRWLPADLVHIWGTIGDNQRLEWSAHGELLSRGSVLPYTVVLHVAHGTRFTTVGGLQVKVSGTACGHTLDLIQHRREPNSFCENC